VIAPVIATTAASGLSRDCIGLSAGRLPVQLGVGLLGVPIALGSYLALPPAPVGADLWADPLALTTVAGVGVLEELVYRGALRAAAARAMGLDGLVYVSAIAASSVLSVGSAYAPALTFAVSLAFSCLVSRSGSLLGVSIAHVTANVLYYLVLPLLGVPSPLGDAGRLASPPTRPMGL
jgi:hypothetical protein